MASEMIIADVGMLYKRLFNHRPIIQNEVQYFVREFETKHENSDLKTLQSAMSKSDEMNTIFLNEIACSNLHFKTIRDKTNIIKETSDKILSEEKTDLWVSQEEQARSDKKVEDYSEELKQKQEQIFSANEEEIRHLKEEIQEVREARSKLRSCGSSVGSSVTIYPPASVGSITPSPEEKEQIEESKQEEMDKEEEGTAVVTEDSTATVTEDTGGND